MDALDAVLRPIARLLNRNIEATTPARELCEQLEGKTVAIRVTNTGLAAAFFVRRDAIDLSTELPAEPDVVISGSLLTLAGMAGDAGVEAIRKGDIDLSGDAETAQQFQKLLQLARPDIEEELSGVIGDVAAHRLGSLLRGAGRWARDARSTMGVNIREYLQEESRDAPSRYEVERFSKNVGVLRDDVDRLEARLKRLEAAQ